MASFNSIRISVAVRWRALGRSTTSRKESTMPTTALGNRDISAAEENVSPKPLGGGELKEFLRDAKIDGGGLLNAWTAVGI